MSRARQILVGDPSPLFRRGIRLALSDQRPALRVEEADRLVSGQARLGNGTHPMPALASFDLLILSGNLRGLERWQQLQGLRRPVLLVTEGVDPQLQMTARAHRVAGVIQRGASSDCLKRAVAALLRGERSYPWTQPVTPATPAVAPDGLTLQQTRVLRLVRQGLGNKQIAARLHVSESTVKHHITRLYRLLEFDSPNRTLLALNPLAAHSPAATDSRAR